MKTQTKRRGVEAGGAREAERAQLRATGLEFDQFLRTEIDLVAHSGPQVPAPRELFYEIGRKEDQRPMSIATVGAAVRAIAASPQVTDVRFFAFAAHVAGWICSLRALPVESLTAHWARETKEQADADVAQAAALRAVETRDLAALDAAIAETTQHLSETQRLCARLIAARRDVLIARRDASSRPALCRA
jgi:hypothetical protein